MINDLSSNTKSIVQKRKDNVKSKIKSILMVLENML